MKQRLNQGGQELVETGMTIVLFLIMALGVLMFGHAFMVVNMITHAARDGARLAASWNSRDGCQKITNYQAIMDAVNAKIATVSGETFNVIVDQQPGPITTSSPPCSPAPGLTPTVTVNVNGCVPYLFNIWGFGSAGCPPGSFHVNRTVTFADEFRG